jgi:hypothetical protein
LDGWNPINNGINHLSTGAGFLPSTVSLYLISQMIPVWLSLFLGTLLIIAGPLENFGSAGRGRKRTDAWLHRVLHWINECVVIISDIYNYK